MRTRRSLVRFTVAAVLATATLGATAGTADAEAPEHCRAIHSAIKNWSLLQEYASDTYGQWIYYMLETEMAMAMAADMGC
jgi:hypothetical protein